MHTLHVSLSVLALPDAPCFCARCCSEQHADDDVADCAGMGEEDAERAVQQALSHVAALLQKPLADMAERGDAQRLFKVVYGPCNKTC